MRITLVDLTYSEPNEVLGFDFLEGCFYSCMMTHQLNIDLDLLGCEINFELPYYWLFEALQEGRGICTTIEVRELDMELQLDLEVEDIYTLIN